MNSVINLNEGDRVKGQYRGYAYSGIVREFNWDVKRRLVSAYVILDDNLEGSDIMPRKAGEGLKINETTSTIEVVC